MGISQLSEMVLQLQLCSFASGQPTVVRSPYGEIGLNVNLRHEADVSGNGVIPKASLMKVRSSAVSQRNSDSINPVAAHTRLARAGLRRVTPAPN